MTIPPELISLISAGIAFASLIYAVSRRSAEGSADVAKLDAKLASISSGVDDLRVEMRSMRNDQVKTEKIMAAHEARLQTLEKAVFK